MVVSKCESKRKRERDRQRDSWMKFRVNQPKVNGVKFTL